jgi:predicted O-methyltransferase YrrM
MDAQMSQEQWTAVDRYISELLIPSDPALDHALQSSKDSGLPAINVSPPLGKLLLLMATMKGAVNILEIGTLGAYSTIWLARALPGDKKSLPAAGRLVTLEADPKHAEIAQENIARAGLSGLVEVRLGPAQDTLPQLAAEGYGPFDFIFIDADKEGYPTYFEWSMKLSCPGTVILADNIVRGGAVVDGNHADPRVHGVRRFLELVAAEPRVTATVIQTVGSKGYDGYALAVVTGE